MNRKGVTLIELAVVTGIFLVIIVVLAPFVHMAKARANRINCANKLMGISLGLHSYAREHNGAFPASLGALYPNYLQDPAAFDCPASKRVGTKTEPEYRYTAGLTENSSPKEIIAEDTDGNHKKSGKNILRVDGSVEWVRVGKILAR